MVITWGFQGGWGVMAGTGMFPLAKWASPPPTNRRQPTDRSLPIITIIIIFTVHRLLPICHWFHNHVWCLIVIWIHDRKSSFHEQYLVIFVQITNFPVYLSGFVRPAWFIHTTHALFGQEGNVSTVFFGKSNKDLQSEPAKVNFLLRLPVWLC